MRYAIISDIHANESALRHVLADAAELDVDQVVCLGDVVGYGPLPKDALALVRESCSIVLAGNHDDAVSGRRGADDFIDLAGDAVKRHRDTLGSSELGWLKNLPYACKLEGAIAAHGDFTNPPDFNYVDDEASATANFKTVDAQLMFVGHTHIPGIFLTGQSGSVYQLEPQDFTVEDGKRYIVNPGSVGYPREQNDTCLSSYVIYDSTERAVNFRFLPFAVSSVMQLGTNPKRWIGIVVTGLLAVAAVCATFFFSRGNSPVEKEVRVEASPTENSKLLLTQKSLTLTKSMKEVRANLKLARKSPAVDLTVEFRNTLGESLGRPISKPVARSCATAFPIPDGAVSVHFTVLKQKPGDQPGLVSFAPSAQ